MQLYEIHASMDLWDTTLNKLVRVSSAGDTAVCAKPKDGPPMVYKGTQLDRLRKPTTAEKRV